MTTPQTRRHLRRWYIALPVALVGVLILAACGGSTSSTPSSGGMAGMTYGSGSMTTEQAAFDRQFIDMMVPHHMGAIEMAKIAQNRGEHPEIKQLAQNIIASQNSEITQMKQWRMTWFGSDQTPSMNQMPMLPGMDMTAMNSMNMTQDIKNLQTATPFDQAFLQAMIPHHQSAIDAAKVAKDQGVHPEIKTLAGSIITSQQKEIDQMKGWLKAWYGQ